MNNGKDRDTMPAPPHEFDFAEPSQIDSLATQLDDIRGLALRGNTDGVDLAALGHFRIAMSLIGQATASLDLASLAQARGIASAPR